MRTWPMSVQAGGGLVPALAAAKALGGIGTADFAPCLLDAVREGAPASYCSILSVSRTHGAQMIAGASINGKDVFSAGREYVMREYYRRDRNGLLEGELGKGRISLQQRGEVTSDWRSYCYDPYGITERCSLVLRAGEDDWLSVNFYRRHDEPRFQPRDLAWLRAFAPVVLSAVTQHRRLWEHMQQSSPEQRLKGLCAGLSPREREVVLAACQGLTNKEIAEQLDLEVTTVVTYRQRAYQRLGIRTHSELVRRLLSPATAESSQPWVPGARH